MKNLFQIIGLVLLGFGLGWWIHQPDITPSLVTIHDTITVGNVDADFLKTLVSKQSSDSVKNKLQMMIAKLKFDKNNDELEWIERLDSLINLLNEAQATIDNYHADSTFKRIPIQIVTAWDDSSRVDTVYAEVSVHAEFFSDPLYIFHDLRIRTAPLTHSVSFTPKPSVVYEGKGLYFGGDAGWKRGNIAFGGHIGFDNLRLHGIVINEDGTLLMLSFDK